MNNYTHLSLEERATILSLSQQGYSKTEIAKQLGRHRSTLDRELKRNKDRQSDFYHPVKAQQKADQRRCQQRKGKIERYSTLRQYVRDRLKEGWSPEQISGRLRRKKSKYLICHETIYQFIYRHPESELYRYLTRKKPKRCRKFSRKPRLCKFGDKRIITERDKLDGRWTYGHWEGDRIEFEREKSAAITTLVEQKTKLVVLIKNNNKKSEHVMSAIVDKLAVGPANMCRTITFDQGVEFANYALVERSLGCKIFYCHRHSPWEKGMNENMNGRIRKFLPSSTDIHQLDQKMLDELSKRLNNTPRKCLGYKTPKEVFLIRFKGSCRTWF